jgi:hypothetical protein
MQALTISVALVAGAIVICVRPLFFLHNTTGETHSTLLAHFQSVCLGASNLIKSGGCGGGLYGFQKCNKSDFGFAIQYTGW